MMLSLSICHLYPDLMDTYGDMGNIITIVKRCQWRGVKVNLKKVGVGDSLSTDDFDFFFFGGGQDKAQVIVGKDLKNKKSALFESIDAGVVFLSICGGYQLLQKYFKTIDGATIDGIGLFDAYTLGSKDRMIHNLLIEINPEFENQVKETYPLKESAEALLPGVNRLSNLKKIATSRKAGLAMTNGLKHLIGFENHSGKTYLGKDVKPLGVVIKGSGNNGEDKTEGAVYKNAFGCYLHGSLLPKNPHFADFLITKALARRYGIVKLKPLDDSIEWQAHNSAITRTRSQP